MKQAYLQKNVKMLTRKNTQEQMSEILHIVSNSYSRLRKFVRKRLLTAEERRHSMVGPAHLWKLKRDFQLEFLKKQGLRADHSVLDIGCGTLRGGIPLIEYLEEERYAGTDVRAEALAEGMLELVQYELEDKRPTLLLAPDLEKLHLGRRFDVIWSFSVLIHMTDPIFRDALAFVAEHLKARGSFYANLNVGERPPGRWDRFPVRWRTMNTIVGWAKEAGLVVKDIGELSSFGHVSGETSQDSQRMLEFTLPSREDEA